MADNNTNQPGRRTFTQKILKILALTTGISMLDLEKILAENTWQKYPIQKSQKINKYSINQKETNDVIRGLKALIEQDQRLFENEYGHVTPIRQIERIPNIPMDIFPGDHMNMCAVHWIDKIKGMLDGLNGCGVLFVNGAGCGQLVSCEGGNNCTGQSCPNLCECAPNNCPGNDCPQLGNCLPGCGCKGGNTQILDESFFDHYKEDPYIQQLSQELHATNTAQLSQQVNSMLQKKKQQMIQQPQTTPRKF